MHSIPQNEAIDFLSDPANLDADGPVERIDTHAAIVFLTGTRAFKLKRAIAMPYLDFTSVETRRSVCEAEYRLNSRTAPDMYRGCRAIVRLPDGTLSFGDPSDGEPVDWVVEMRRFPADALFTEIARRGELSPELLRSLADHVADFHQKAARAEEAHGAQRVRKVIDGNRESMEGMAAHGLPAADCEKLYRRSLAVLERLAPLLDERGRAGLVRHCHGDMHLANICLWNGEPTLFDCLEFDEELTTTDTLYDLAFLLMDLWARECRTESSIVFNRYCDMTGEAEGLAALPLFLSMRASVRAHVAASSAMAASEDGPAAEKREEAAAYLASARSFLEGGSARLVAVGGLSGTGKSTLAGNIAADIGRAPGARWLRSDVMRKRMAGLPPEAPLPPSAYSPESSRAVYDRLASEARSVLGTGQSVLVDAVFADPQEREAIEHAAIQAGTPFTGLWLEAPLGVMRERVEGRRNDASDADVKVVDRQADYDVGPLGSWHVIDAGGTARDVARHAGAVIARTSPS